MKCPYCNNEFSDPVAEIHISNNWCMKKKTTENASKNSTNKKSDKQKDKQE